MVNNVCLKIVAQQKILVRNFYFIWEILKLSLRHEVRALVCQRNRAAGNHKKFNSRFEKKSKFSNKAGLEPGSILGHMLYPDTLQENYGKNGCRTENPKFRL